MWREMVALLLLDKSSLCQNNRATKTRPIIQDGGAREIWKQKYAILKFVFLHYRHSSGKKKKLKLTILQILYPGI